MSLSLYNSNLKPIKFRKPVFTTFLLCKESKIMPRNASHMFGYIPHPYPIKSLRIVFGCKQYLSPPPPIYWKKNSVEFIELKHVMNQ